MSIAIFPGSFDPITNGHLDIIKTSSKIFDKVIVAVSYNINKKSFLPLETRKELIIKSVSDIKNVNVETYTDLTVDFAKKCSAEVIIRGLRNSADFEYEQQMAGVNFMLSPKLQTIFLLTKPEFSSISSSVVREIVQNNGNISNFVPFAVKEYLDSAL